MGKLYTPILGVQHATQPNSPVTAMLSGGSVTLIDKEKRMTFRLSPAVAICYKVSADQYSDWESLDKSDIVERLTEYRKSVPGWDDEDDTAMLGDICKAIGFDDIDIAYICGDIEELYRKAR